MQCMLGYCGLMGGISGSKSAVTCGNGSSLMSCGMVCVGLTKMCHLGSTSSKINMRMHIFCVLCTKYLLHWAKAIKLRPATTRVYSVVPDSHSFLAQSPSFHNHMWNLWKNHGGDDLNACNHCEKLNMFSLVLYIMCR